MSRLVTSSADLGFDDLRSRVRGAAAPSAPHHEQLLVLGAAKSVEDHRDSARRRFRAGRPALRRRGVAARSAADGIGCPHPRLAVDAEAEAHLVVGHGEQRGVGARQGAAVERDTRVRVAALAASCDADDAGQVEPVFGSGGCALEDGEIACNPATFCFLALGCAGDVIGDGEVVAPSMPSACNWVTAKPKFITSPGIVSGGEQHASVAVALRGAHRLRASSADGDVKMLPTTAPSAKPVPTVPQNAG